MEEFLRLFGFGPWQQPPAYQPQAADMLGQIEAAQGPGPQSPGYPLPPTPPSPPNTPAVPAPTGWQPQYVPPPNTQEGGPARHLAPGISVTEPYGSRRDVGETGGTPTLPPAASASPRPGQPSGAEVSTTGRKAGEASNLPTPEAAGRVWDFIKNEWRNFSSQPIPEAQPDFPRQGEPTNGSSAAAQNGPSQEGPLPTSGLPGSVIAGAGQQTQTPGYASRQGGYGPAATPRAPGGTGGRVGTPSAPSAGPAVGPAPLPATTPAASAPAGAAQGREGRGFSTGPEFWRTLGVISMSLMRPVAPGSNWLGHVGDALGAGFAYTMLNERATADRALAERKQASEEAKTGAAVRRSDAATKRDISTLGPDIQAKLARIRAIDMDIANTSDVMASRRLQRERDGISLEVERATGMKRAEIDLALKQAQTTALMETPEQKSQKLILEAIKQSTNPLYGTLDINKLRQVSAALGLQWKYVGEDDRAQAQALLSKYRPGTPEHDAMRRRLNDRAAAQGFFPEF